MYVVILAGGSGTRLWPRSRRDRPKHTLELVTDRSLLQDTFDRVSQTVPPANVLVVTEQSHADLIRTQLPELPAANILVEPMRRGTGPAIGWAALHVRRRDPAGVMAVLASDHVILKGEEFCALLEDAAQLAATSKALITFGIPPTEPSSEFGYIHRGQPRASQGGRPVHEVESFKEKPDAVRAREFVDSGEYYWNSGMFCWRADVILAEIERLMPNLHAGLAAIDQAIGTPDEQQVLAGTYPTLPKDTIDYGVLEKAEHVLVLPAEIGWSDVGTWSALLEVLATAEDGNVSLGGGSLLAIDTTNTLVSSPRKLVATIGVSDLVIIDSDSALLVCHRDRAAEVKKIVEQLEAEGRYEHL